MTYLQSNVPSPNRAYVFNLSRFDGGLNNASSQLEDNEASDVVNMTFSDDSLMETRKGTEYFDLITTTNSPIVWLDEYKPYNADNQFLRATAGSLYAENVAIKTLAGEVRGVNHQGMYFFADGAKLYCYGKFPQASASPYIEVVGTAVDSYVVMEVVSPGTYTALDTTHVEGVTKYDYTALKVWYEPCENELTDPSYGANIIPNHCKYLVSYLGMIFASGNKEDDDTVYISHVKSPFYFPVTKSMQLPPNSDLIKGLIVWDSAVVVGRTQDIFMIDGETNDPDLGLKRFTLNKVNTHTGFASGGAVDVVNNHLFYLGADGVCYGLASIRADDKTRVTTIISKTIDLFSSPINSTLTKMAKATSIFINNLWYLSIDDIILVYSYDEQAWTMFDNINATCFYNYYGTLCFGKTNGRVGKFYDGYLDFGKPYRAFWQSKNFDMNEKLLYKYFIEFYVVAHMFAENYSDVIARFMIDYNNVDGQYTIVNATSIWGKTVWGELFVNRTIASSLPFFIGRRGRNIAFRFSNIFNPSGEVATYSDLESVASKFEGMTVYVIDEDAYYNYESFEWVQLSSTRINQVMKIREVVGQYEVRGKR